MIPFVLSVGFFLFTNSIDSKSTQNFRPSTNESFVQFQNVPEGKSQSEFFIGPSPDETWSEQEIAAAKAYQKQCNDQLLRIEQKLAQKSVDSVLWKDLCRPEFSHLGRTKEDGNFEYFYRYQGSIYFMD